MKKLAIIGILTVVFIFGWLLSGSWYSSPLTGRLKTVAVTMQYFSPTATNTNGLNMFEKTVTFQQPEELAAIEKCMASVQNHYSANSMEGFPKYRMQIEYTDGKTQTFVFTRTEWGGSGETPRPLLKALEKAGL